MAVRHLLAAALCASIAVPACAQEVTAQSLIAKNLEARGGAEALGAIKSIRFEGKLVFPGDFELTYDETRARGGPSGVESRTNATIQGMQAVQAYDGRSAWRINPFQGRKDPEKMSADETRSMADSSLIDGVLLASRGDGSIVTYLGREDFDGTSAYKLKVRQKDGDDFTYLLDPDTFLEIKVTETRRMRGAQQTSETELGDYEKVAGVYFPMSIESWQQGQSNQRQRILVEAASANPAVSEALFAEPGSAGPAAATSQPPDASMRQPNEPEKPPTQPESPPQPPEGE
jgi:hypothetical protein